MNKTVTINLSGIVFHIDENAYDTLKKYLESIRSKFTVADGRDEIVGDIEARIAEMFQQRLSDSKQAILPEDVNAVITILGKPEDISEAQETAGATGPVAGDTVYHVKKRFFRSPDDKILGGVCGGISAYFDIDPIWLRLAFALAFFFGGSGILIYIILWVIVPMAKTPSEKLQMRGEDVTLSAIQKSVQDELEGVKTKAGEMVKEVRSKNYGKRLGDFITDVVKLFFTFIGKIISVIFIIISLFILFVLTALAFRLTLHRPTLMILAPHIHVFGIIGLLLLLGVPAVMLFLIGLKWLFKINWSLKKAAGILGGLFLIGAGICLINGINISKHFASKASVSKTVAWQSPHDKVLHVTLNRKSEPVFFGMGFRNSVSRSTGNSSYNYSFEEDNYNDSLIPIDVDLYIEQSATDSVQLVSNYTSRGGSRTEAYSLAQKINYNFSYTDTTLTLDPYGSLVQNKEWRAQKVKLFLKVPLNTSISIANNPNDYNFDFRIHADNDLSSDEFFGHTFTMTPNGLKCVDCIDMPDDDNSILKHQHISI